jgi:hypothetical protein
MATAKKPEPAKADVPEIPTAPPAPIEVVPAEQPKEPMPSLTKPYQTLSDDEIRRVNAIKGKTDDLVSYLKTLRDSYHDAEVQRALSLAITDVETASMWAVRAVTWRG